MVNVPLDSLILLTGLLMAIGYLGHVVRTHVPPPSRRQVALMAFALAIGVVGNIFLPAQTRLIRDFPLVDTDNISSLWSVIDPDRYRIKNPDASTPEPEFYESYGILFEADARDEGPICVEREFVHPTRRCITLATLRQLIWEVQP